MRISKKGILLFCVLLFPSLLYIYFSSGKHHFITLPYFGPKQVVEKTEKGKILVDTLYHTIAPFRFVNQSGDTISELTYKDKIYIADFFFASCKSICPKMAVQLNRVQEKFAQFPEVYILSHTVDPEQDSIQALAAYANMIHANTAKWNFVTGNKKELYDMARHSYFVTALEGDGGPDDFVHSETFVLVDKEKHIRGIYDGTNTKEVNELMDDIKVLIAEYTIKKSKQEKNDK